MDRAIIPLLTRGNHRPTLCPPSLKTAKDGRRKPVFRQGEKSPHSFAAFLCPSKTQALIRLVLCHGGLFWEAERPTAPCRGFPSPFQPATHALGSVGGGYPSFRQGFTA
jgi:hypothetical protein